MLLKHVYGIVSLSPQYLHNNTKTTTTKSPEEGVYQLLDCYCVLSHKSQVNRLP